MCYAMVSYQKTNNGKTFLTFVCTPPSPHTPQPLKKKSHPLFFPFPAKPPLKTQILSNNPFPLLHHSARYEHQTSHNAYLSRCLPECILNFLHQWLQFFFQNRQKPFHVNNSHFFRRKTRVIFELKNMP